jgi:hypothetical protein
MLVSQEKYKKTDFFSFALQREKELEREEKEGDGQSYTSQVCTLN